MRYVAKREIGLQQDSAEVLINVLTQLELAFDPSAAEEGSEPTNLIQRYVRSWLCGIQTHAVFRLFSCKYRQQLSYQLADGAMEDQTPVESVFVHPIIGVEEEGKDLYDCLGELYLKGADVEYEGKKGFMMDLMDEFPPMLYIQMRVRGYLFISYLTNTCRL
jgi:ubiquitin carboxyl-terminal hydrolase 25/28